MTLQMTLDLPQETPFLGIKKLRQMSAPELSGHLALCEKRLATTHPRLRVLRNGLAEQIRQTRAAHRIRVQLDELNALFSKE